MEQFSFLRDYYETLKKIKRKQDQAFFAMAIFEFMFEDKEPDESLSEVSLFAFEIHRKTLEISKVRSGSGTKANGKQKQSKCKANEKQTESKPKANAKQTESKILKESSSPLKESSKENNTSNYKENNPPFLYPPKSGDKPKKNDNKKAVFLEKYSRYAGYAENDDNIDYKVLLDEFEKSTYLRSLYTFKQVVAIYPAIVKGEFRDKDKNPIVSAVDARADRERWYSQRRSQSLSVAERNLETVRKRFKKYAELERALNVAHMTAAKLEYEFDKRQDGYIADKLQAVTSEKERIEEEMQSCLSKCGFTQEDLIPKWHCDKCEDTGYKSDGRACDCYEKSIG